MTSELSRKDEAALSASASSRIDVDLSVFITRLPKIDLSQLP